MAGMKYSTIVPKNIFRSDIVREIPGYTGSMRAFMRSMAKFGELWRTHNVIFRISSLTFTRVPAKVAQVHQSSGEGAFCMRVAFGTYPTWSSL